MEFDGLNSVELVSMKFIEKESRVDSQRATEREGHRGSAVLGTSNKFSPRRRSTAMVVALFSAFVLIAAACGEGEQSADDEGSTATTSTTTTVDDSGSTTDDRGETTDTDVDTSGDEGADDAAMPPVDDEPDCSQAEASDVGVTADTITVGLISVDLEPLFGTGFVNENTVDNFYTRSMSLLHAINENGGINCRQIILVQETYDPSRSAETQAPACERLAQDQEVFVAIAAFPDSAGGGIGCMIRNGLPFVTSGPVSSATIEEAGGAVVGVRPSVEVMADTAAQTYLDLGLLDGEKVAVWGGDSGELAVTRERIVQVLTEAGIDVVDVELPSSGGTVAVWGVVPQVVASMIEQDVTAIITAGSSVTVRNFYLEMQASGADWKWLTVDTQAFGGTFSVAQMPDDWEATTVTSQLHEPRSDAADRECIDAYQLLRGSGLWDDDHFEDQVPEKGNTNSTRPLSNDCALAKLVIVGLQNAGLNPTRESFIEGLNNAGPIEVAFETDGILEPGKAYLSDTARVYSRYPPGAAECVELGYFESLGCWGPFAGDDPGEIPNVVE